MPINRTIALGLRPEAEVEFKGENTVGVLSIEPPVNSDFDIKDIDLGQSRIIKVKNVPETEEYLAHTEITLDLSGVRKRISEYVEYMHDTVRTEEMSRIALLTAQKFAENGERSRILYGGGSLILGLDEMHFQKPPKSRTGSSDRTRRLFDAVMKNRKK